MSLFREIGKLLLVKPHILDEEELSLYRDLSFRNFIFFREHFDEDFVSYREKLCSHLKREGILAVDQEGGKVCRIPMEIESPLDIAEKSQKKGEALFVSWAEKIAKTLKEFDLNLNLAPVVDLADESAEEYLRGRSFGKNPSVVIKFAGIFIDIHNNINIKTTLKHFPGLGEVKTDPHYHLPIKERITSTDLKPFQGLASKVFFIMTTHLLVPSWDRLPVTFSQRAIEVLRKDLNYYGVIVTDDLSMGALSTYPLQERILRSIASGHNLLIYCGSPTNLTEALMDIKTEIEKSYIIRTKVMESLTILEKYSIL